MAVYVDPAAHKFGRMIMCHMWADTEEELHTFAARIGIKRKWFQEPPKASWKHYDISKGKRQLAISLGAVATDKFGPVEHLAKQTGNQKMLDKVEKCRALRNTDRLL